MKYSHLIKIVKISCNRGQYKTKHVLIHLVCTSHIKCILSYKCLQLLNSAIAAVSLCAFIVTTIFRILVTIIAILVDSCRLYARCKPRLNTRKYKSHGWLGKEIAWQDAESTKQIFCFIPHCSCRPIAVWVWHYESQNMYGHTQRHKSWDQRSDWKVPLYKG